MIRYFTYLILIFSVNLFSLDRIVVAKDIITLDNKYPNANALYIKKKRIHAVGFKKDLVKEFPDVLVDYSHQDNIIVPGFIEHHIHPLLAAITMNSHVVAIDDWNISSKKT